MRRVGVGVRVVRVIDGCRGGCRHSCGGRVEGSFRALRGVGLDDVTRGLVSPGGRLFPILSRQSLSLPPPFLGLLLGRLFLPRVPSWPLVPLRLPFFPARLFSLTPRRPFGRIRRREAFNRRHLVHRHDRPLVANRVLQPPQKVPRRRRREQRVAQRVCGISGLLVALRGAGAEIHDARERGPGARALRRGRAGHRPDDVV
mmetsp:Transcript_5742/g.25877  ORF Transcript_5742/g.25877 Transcript_5742/m.25877 type:complete len:201 (-) Transcript_5742:877-1479(-)